MKKLITIAILCLLSFNIFATPYWYKSQVGTGVGNCGPACIAMVLTYKLQRNFTVQKVRELIGYKYADGRTSYDDIKKVLNKYSIFYLPYVVDSYQDFVYIINNNMVIVCTTYYGGHYVIVKDNKIQDPLQGPDRTLDTKKLWSLLKYKQIILISKDDTLYYKGGTYE